jgi:hypothetical protein
MEVAAFGTAEYWQERADEARQYLEKMSDPSIRRQVEEIIAVYDRLAKETEKTPRSGDPLEN